MKKIIVILVFTAVSGVVCAESASKAVEQGNRYYLDGMYKEAAGEYDKASELKADSMVPQFNKANSLYQLGEYDNAAELYRKVAAESRDTALVKAAKLNLGNCYIKMGYRKLIDPEYEKKIDDLEKALQLAGDAMDAAEKNKKVASLAKANKELIDNIDLDQLRMPDLKMGKVKLEDMEAALGKFKEAVNAYRQVLDIDQENKKAGQNIAVSKEAIQKIAQQKKQMEQQQKEQQEKQREAKEKLEDVKEKQQKLAEENKQTQEKQQKGEISQEQAQEEFKQQQQKQQQLNEETKQAAQQAQEAFGDGEETKNAAKNVKDAMADQQKAAEQLGAADGKEAKESQDDAAKKLQKAIDELSKGDEKQKQDDGKKSEDDEKKNGEKDDNDKGEQGDQQDQPQNGEDQQDEQETDPQQAPDATAEQILNKEKQDKKNRRAIGIIKVPVEKDW